MIEEAFSLDRLHNLGDCCPISYSPPSTIPLSIPFHPLTFPFLPHSMLLLYLSTLGDVEPSSFSSVSVYFPPSNISLPHPILSTLGDVEASSSSSASLHGSAKTDRSTAAGDDDDNNNDQIRSSAVAPGMAASGSDMMYGSSMYFDR